MGRTVNLSPLGLYNWDSTIFDLMQIPPELDKDTLVKNLLGETAELEVLYPNPVVFKNLIAVWSAKNIDVWQRLYNTTQYEYNPIENYNRYEEGTTSNTGNETHSGTDRTTDSETHSGTDVRTLDRDLGGTDHGTNSGTAGHWIAGFDSTPVSASDDGLVKQTRDQSDSNTSTTYGGTEDVEERITHGQNISNTGQKTYGEEIDRTNDGEHTLHAHGNIGVTTTQKLIKEQRQIDLFNVYDIIIEDFKMRFCILIY